MTKAQFLSDILDHDKPADGLDFVNGLLQIDPDSVMTLTGPDAFKVDFSDGSTIEIGPNGHSVITTN